MARGRPLRIIDSTALMQAASMALRKEHRTVGFVPTMGALHEGHAALIREARQRADVVVVSIFVNPLQFDDPADLARYPNSFDADVAMCRTSDVDVVFRPDNKGLYPQGFETTVVPGALAEQFEGATRKGHFTGVTTVVTKLFALVQPHFAVFGEKDYQQLTVVKRMVRDLHIPIEIVAMPVIRDADGLALSSRNARLSVAQREKATCLYRALTTAQDMVSKGERDAREVEAAAMAVLKGTAGFSPDYCAVVAPDTLASVPIIGQTARLLLAGTFGKGKGGVRLIDNGPLFAPR